MNSRILAILSNIGLNHHESVIYMSCLEMGPSLAGAIIYKTKLPRATVYDSLARLSEKGLIAKSVKKNVAIFTANHPERLKSILDGEKRRINQAYNELDTLDEMLWNMSQNNMRIPKVRLYEGFTWVEIVLNDSLSATETIYTYSDVEGMETKIKKINDAYLAKRKKNNIPKIGLVYDSPYARTLMAGYDKRVTNVRFLPKTMKPFTIEMNIYNDKISYITYRDNNPIGVIIEDRDIYLLHRNSFELLWEACKENI